MPSPDSPQSRFYFGGRLSEYLPDRGLSGRVAKHKIERPEVLTVEYDIQN